MPYRRLPNTDQARIRALSILVTQGNLTTAGDLPISFKILHEAKNHLNKMEQAKVYYTLCLKKQAEANRKYQLLLQKARLYVTHFIQVLNMCVQRGEIKEEIKNMFELPLDSYATPDVITEFALLHWGEVIIKGEQNRINKGSTPIYNPPIAKVKVHFDLFKDSYEYQKRLQQITRESLQAIADLREVADHIILESWNQIEAHFGHFEGEARLNKCRTFGVVYYYRSYEKPAGQKIHP